MNKILTKVTALCVGLAMVAGVGVAVGSKKASEAKAADTLSYTLDFKANATDTDNSTALGTNVSDYFIDGASYVASLSSSKVYLGKSSMNGVKFGSSSAKGTLTLTLASTGQVKATKITLALAMYDSGQKVNVSINGASSGTGYSQLSPANSLTDYDVAWDGTNNLSTIKVEANVASKCRFYLDYIKVYVDDGGGSCEHNWVAGTVHAATCETDGYTEYECSECHETKNDDIVAALGHDYGSWTEVTAATCLTAGEERRVCSRDSTHVETRPIAALGHSYVDGVCERCGAIEPDETTADYVFSDHYSADTEVENTPIAFDDYITVVFVKGGTATKYYANGTAVRWYSGGSLTVTSTSGNIQSISLIYTRHDNSVSTVTGSYSDISSSSGTGSWVGDASEVVFTQSGTSGHNRISSMSVTYDNGGEPPVTYTITYLANASDAEGSMSPTTAAAPEVAACTFTRDGYEFARWNTQADGEGDNYDVGTSVSEDLTLYVIWQEYVAPIEGNVTMEGVTSASAVTVNGHPGLKCGAGSTAGSMKLVLSSASISKIKVYVAGWKGDTSKTINIGTTGCSIADSSISITEDSAITGTATAFTLTGTETTYRFTFVVSNATAGAEITLTAAQASKNRFVVWGATDLFAESFAEEFDDTLTCDVSGANEPTFASGKSWTTLESFYNGLDGEEQGKLQDATFTVEGSGSSTVVTATGETSQSVAEAMARYDFIEGKYNPSDSLSSPYKNFIGRTVHPLGNSSYALNYQSNLDASSSIMIIVIVAVTSMTLLGVTLVIRKRKHQ